jgi:hypothetical protein
MLDEGDRVMGGEPRPGWGMTAVHWEQEELIVECGPGVFAETARRAVVQLLASGRIPSLEPRGHRAEVALSALIGRLWVGAERCEGRLYVVVIIGSRGLVALPSGRSPG